MKMRMVRISTNFYPRSPCGERRDQATSNQPKQQISIHALLAESDQAKALKVAAHGISIHALLAESDFCFSVFDLLDLPFLSTLSLRRATHTTRPTRRPLAYFYPRSPCGERLTGFPLSIQFRKISIHALLAESDRQRFSHCYAVCDFYPRSPCGERPDVGMRIGYYRYFYPRSPCGERLFEIRARMEANKISIHALLAESDAIYPSSTPPKEYFYPRSPCGERHDTSSLMQCQAKFLSTLSLRRATALRQL